MTDIKALSKPDAFDFPAKTFQEQGETHLGISVYQHGLLTALVCRELMNTLRFPIKDDVLPPELAALAAVHDVGKLNPYFLRRLLRNVSPSSSEFHRWDQYTKDCLEAEEVVHSTISAVTLKEMLVPRKVAEILEMHHGYPPPTSEPRADAYALGSRSWEAMRETVVTALLEAVGAQRFPKLLKTPLFKANPTAQRDAWLGLIVVSDWIASQVETAVAPGSEAAMAARLVRSAGFEVLKVHSDLTYSDIFGFSLRPAQQKLVDLYAGPGTYVFEAPTGYGKTEAALALAFHALVKGAANGIYFALPTQLTSNRLFDRFSVYVSKMVGNGAVSRLIHSGARLLQTEIGKEGAPGDIWFSQNRRALLAPFAVGTVDQALLSELSVRFSCVRAAGLLGKVIIFDEIHSYDAYTSTLIQRLLRRLEALGNTCVVLSATLTDDARRRLLGVKESSVVADSSPIRFSRKLLNDTDVYEVPMQLSADDAHPVRVKLVENYDVAFDEAIQHVRSGEQVLWIENTVAQAQRVFSRCKAAGVECGLIHSRFRAVDRERIETRWTHIYGKHAGEERQVVGRILIGTQVLEQSLDLDADFLVTRIAPMDLLIQRIGRLWRHKNTKRPASCQEAAAWILTCPEEGSRDFPDQPIRSQFGKSGLIYGPPYALYRTLESLKTRLASDDLLKLPNEARPLLESVYAEREEAEGTEGAQFKQELAASIEKLERMALSAVSFNGLQDDAVEPSTRNIELPAIEVLVVTPDEAANCPATAGELSLWLEQRIVKATVSGADLPNAFDMHEKAKDWEKIQSFLQTTPRRFRSVKWLDVSSELTLLYDQELGLLIKKTIS